MNAETQAELNALIRALQGVSDVAKKDSDRVLTEAAGPLRAAIAGRAPVSDAPHSRYSTPKISRKLRAPKGSGVVAATYQPGNLAKSFSVLSFRRARFAKFIGPKVRRSAGQTPDGYYAHMVNFGTVQQPAQRFVEAGVAAGGGVARNLAVRLMKQTIDNYARQKGLT